MMADSALQHTNNNRNKYNHFVNDNDDDSYNNNQLMMSYVHAGQVLYLYSTPIETCRRVAMT